MDLEVSILLLTIIFACTSQGTRFQSMQLIKAEYGRCFENITVMDLKWRLLFLPILIACTSQAKKGQPIELTEAEYRRCFYSITCKAGRADVFGKFLEKAGPKMRKEAYQSLQDEGLPNARNTLKFWDTEYAPYKCKETEKIKQQQFDDYVKSVSQYYKKVCSEDPNDEECRAYEPMNNEVNKAMIEFTLKGYCHPKAENLIKEKKPKKLDSYLYSK